MRSNLACSNCKVNPGHFWRIVLLISEQNDAGSTTPPEEALRILGMSGTAVYSLTFAAPKRIAKTKEAHRRHTVDQSSPLAPALKELRDHTATELAAFTGGVQLSFSTPGDFDDAMKLIGTDIRNRYALGFQPANHEPGLHQLSIKVREGLNVTARGGYWFDPAANAR
jgi:hypothetical protein